MSCLLLYLKAKRESILRVTGCKLFHSTEPKYPTLRLNASQRGMATLNRGASCALVLISLLFKSAGLDFLMYIKFRTCALLLSLRNGAAILLWAWSVSNLRVMFFCLVQNCHNFQYMIAVTYTLYYIIIYSIWSCPIQHQIVKIFTIIKILVTLWYLRQ